MTLKVDNWEISTYSVCHAHVHNEASNFGYDHVTEKLVNAPEAKAVFDHMSKTLAVNDQQIVFHIQAITRNADKISMAVRRVSNFDATNG